MNHFTSPTAALVASYIMENREDLDQKMVESLIGFSVWAQIREEDEYFPEQAGVAAAGKPLQASGPVPPPEAPKPQAERQQQSQGGGSLAADYDGSKTQHSAKEISDSITHEYLISFEDGKRYRTLRPHLGRKGMTADQYIKKHGLPEDYPMVAPEYSSRRSALAKQAGLGGRRSDNNKK